MCDARRLLLVMSMVAAGLGCARSGERRLSPRPHPHAEPAVIQRQMAALVRKLTRATRTLERVAEARSAILDLGPHVTAPEVTDAPLEPVESKRTEQLRGALAEVRRQLYVHEHRFCPDVVALRRLEAELVERMPPSER